MTQDQLPKATHQGELAIAGTKIPCYVLDGGERILSTRGVMHSLGRRWRGRKYAGTQLPVFLEAKNLKPFIDKELSTVPTARNFRTTKGAIGEGYSADLLPKVCNIYLEARDAGNVLTSAQKAVATKADILMRGLATVGIIALIDEATGYQDTRDRIALQRILQKYISKELMEWQKRFPDVFYEEMFRLRQWQWRGRSVNPPQLVGKLTNDIVYDRLAPGVLHELKKREPKNSKGNRSHRLHQWLTIDVGDPKLQEHLISVITLMRASANWASFKRLLARALPKPGEQIEADLD